MATSGATPPDSKIGYVLPAVSRREEAHEAGEPMPIKARRAVARPDAASALGMKSAVIHKDRHDGRLI
jgi:hypothetical protein